MNVNKKQIIEFDGIKIPALDKAEVEGWETGFERVKETFKFLDLKPGDKVLDVGCYSGAISAILKKKFPQIDLIAIEIDDERIAMAKSRGIKVHKVDIEKDLFPFDDNEFDVVLFIETLEHLANPSNALKEIKRVTKSSGDVIISTPNSVGLFARYNHLRGISPHYVPFLSSSNIQRGHKNEFSYHRFELNLQQAKDLLNENGYQIEKIKMTRLNHQKRGLLVKLIEKLSLLKDNWSDNMIFKCQIKK